MISSITSLRPIDWAVVVLPIALAPLLLFPRPLSLLALVVPAAIAAARIARDGRIAPRSPLTVPVLLLLVASATSAFATPSLQQSAGKLGGIALGGLVLWAVLVFAQSRRALRLVIAAFVACGALIAGVSLMGTTWEAKIELMRPVVSLFPVRWKGLPGAEEGFNANPVGATMTMFVSLTAMTSWRLWRGNLVTPERPWRHALVAVSCSLTLLLLGVLVLSQSRGAWMGFGIGLAVAWVCSRRSWLAWMGATLLTLLVAAIIASTLPAPGRSLMPATLQDALAVQGRGELWARGLMIIRDFPITGIGPNVSRKLVPVAYPPFDSPPATPVPHTHNGFVQTAVDIGLPGLTAYVAVWTVFLAMLVRIVRRSLDSGLRQLALGLLAGAVAIGVFQMTDAIPLGAKVGTLWWVMVALAMAAASLELSDNQTRRSGGVWQPIGAWLAGSAAAVLVAGASPVLALCAAGVGGVACGLQAVAQYDFTHGIAARPVQR